MKLNSENIASVEEKIGRYKWLKGIADEYEQMIKLIEREGDAFVVYGIDYAARGDIRSFTVNSHRSIPHTFILDGFKAALTGIKEEMAQIEKELQ